MRNRIFFIYIFLFGVFTANVFSQSYEDIERIKNNELKKSLEDFFAQFISFDVTEEIIINRYGQPDKIEHKKTGYLNDEITKYIYDEAYSFTFFYKTDDNIKKLVQCKIYQKITNSLSIPNTPEGICDMFNSDFEKCDFPDKNYYNLCYFGNFTVNFHFVDDTLIYISWSDYNLNS